MSNYDKSEYKEKKSHNMKYNKKCKTISKRQLS